MDAYAVPKTEYRYRDPQRLTDWLRISLGVDAVLSLIYLADSFAVIAVPGTAKALPIVLDVWALGFVTATVLLLVWVFRVTANVHALGGDITFQAGGAIGWMVAPILALWMAFVVIDEVWRGSVDAPGWRAHHVGWSAIYWWAAWVVASLGAVLLWTSSGGIAAKVVYFGAHAAHVLLLRPIAARISELQQNQFLKAPRA